MLWESCSPSYYGSNKKILKEFLVFLCILRRFEAWKAGKNTQKIAYFTINHYQDGRNCYHMLGKSYSPSYYESNKTNSKKILELDCVLRHFEVSHFWELFYCQICNFWIFFSTFWASKYCKGTLEMFLDFFRWVRKNLKNNFPKTCIVIISILIVIYRKNDS